MIGVRRFAPVLLAISAFVADAAAADRQGAKAFLRRIYAPYLAGDASVAPTAKAAPAIFAPPLLALIRKDQAEAHGEVGTLDSDPICDCQDFDRLKSLSITVAAKGSDHATATVRFVNGTTPVMLRYTLAITRRGWRVEDIGSKETPSLVALLKGGAAAR